MSAKADDRAGLQRIIQPASAGFVELPDGFSLRQGGCQFFLAT
jgi:hypothetical protein